MYKHTEIKNWNKMKKLIVVLLMLPILGFGQQKQYVNLKHSTDTNKCIKIDIVGIERYLVEKTIKCQINSLTNGKFVKQCLIEIDDDINLVVMSNAYFANEGIKTMYLDLYVGDDIFYIKGDDIEKNRSFFEKIDKLLENLSKSLN